MHELPITQGILDTALDAAQRNGGRRILTIQIVIGELSSFVDDSIQFYFTHLSQGTLAENAVLQFRREPTTVLCLDCGQTLYARAPLPLACPHCARVRLRANGGRELYVESIEVADENSNR